MKTKRFPLAWCQKGFWYFFKNDPEDLSFIICVEIHFKGYLDSQKLHASLQDMVDRHEILRTVFSDENGDAEQIVLSQLPVHFERIKSQCTSVKDRTAEIDHLMQQQPFDLSKGPLMRNYLVKYDGDGTMKLVQTYHHIIFDAMSVKIMSKELQQFYLARKKRVFPDLKPLILYSDFITWESKMLTDQGKKTREYWHSKLKSGLPKVFLPTDFPYSEKKPKGDVLILKLDEKIFQRLKESNLSIRYSTPVVLLAAYQLLLHRYSQQKEIPFAFATQGRSLKFKQTLGHFVNPVVLKSLFVSEQSVSDYLALTKKEMIDALKNQTYPFTLLIQELEIKPEQNLPILPFAFNFIPKEFYKLYHQKDCDWDGAEIIELDAQQPPVSGVQHDLHLKIQEFESELKLFFDFNASLFSKITITSIFQHFQGILSSILKNPDQKIGQFSLLTQDEKNRIFKWSNAGVKFEKNLPIHKWFEEQADIQPDGIALIDWKQEYTFSQLDQTANQIANYLINFGVCPELFVGVCMDRTASTVAGLLGILKAGAAYVPLDPNLPPKRISYIAADTTMSIILSETKHKDRLPENVDTVIFFDAKREEIGKQSNKRPDVEVSLTNLAYAIYTSGSTGNPKGVAIEHQSVSALISSFKKIFSTEEIAGVFGGTSLNFDVSVMEVFATLGLGGCLILAKNHLALPDLPAKEKITLIKSVPSVIQELIQAGLPENITTICLGGEVVKRELVDQLYTLGHIQKVIIEYGPTEETVWATYFKASYDMKNDPYIGRPVSKTEVYVLDANLKPVPVGVPGELHLGGLGLARGYINLPEKTAQAFIPNPFSKDHKKRIYKTGDLVKWSPDGNLVFVGRIDHQVKIRGFRIELGEIENCLVQYYPLNEAVVVAKAFNGEKKLVAYFTTLYEKEIDINGIDINGIKNFCRKHLPAYMIPEFFVEMQEFPTTPTGKLDRNALPIPDMEMLCNVNFVSPKTKIEKQLSTILAQMLDREKISINEGFFDIGLSSLQSLSFIARIKKELKKELKITDIFQYPNIGALSKYLSGFINQKKQENHIKRKKLPVKKKDRHMDMGHKANDKGSPISKRTTA